MKKIIFVTATKADDEKLKSIILKSMKIQKIYNQKQFKGIDSF